MYRVEVEPAAYAVLAAEAAAKRMSEDEVAIRVIVLVGWDESAAATWRTSAAADAFASLVARKRVGRESAARRSDDDEMAAVDLDDLTHAMVRFAATVSGMTESQVIARAVQRYTEMVSQPRDEPDPWLPVDVWAEYEGHHVEGKYLPATGRLTVTTGPVADTAYKSPSAAARAVIASLNPSRTSTQTNGWKFWRIGESGDRLDVLRKPG